ncbi:MAG: hypothetical protein RL490_1502, partial [Pseudomonadota bacterium]
GGWGLGPQTPFDCCACGHARTEPTIGVWRPRPQPPEADLYRRTLLAAGLAALLPMPALAAAKATVVEEWTFLRSLDPDPADLIAFIRANWFVMDRVAVAQGLFTHYALYRSDDGGDWNVAVVVGYAQAQGYAGVRAAFEAIRAAHVPVPIKGKDLKALGRIIGTRSVTPLAAR